MSLTNPLSASAFFDNFQVEDCQFVQQYNQQQSIEGGGDVNYADRSVALWMAECTSILMPLFETEAKMALINSRGGGLKTILMYNKRMPYPIDDPSGSIIGSTEPEIGTITDRLHISFTDFPANYILAQGTFFGCIFDTSRYYLGQIVEATQANGSGSVSETEIWPPLPAGIVTETVISVSKPCAKFVITPNSAYPSMQGSVNAKISFSAKQTYRV